MHDKKKKKAVVDELHKPARRNYTRRHVDIRGIDETWQADLVDMSDYAYANRGYKYLLTVIDIFSKYAWAIPIKSKSGLDTTAAMRSVLVHGRVPAKLHVDNGKEFYNTNFQSLMKEFKIHMYSTFSTLKASICERFNRTLKNKMWKEFSLRGTFKWIDILENLVSTYNNTVHRTIAMKPKDVSRKNAERLLHRVYVKPSNHSVRKRFKVGDKVRISKFKNIFAKGYTPNWSTEIFTVAKVIETNPPTYKLKDYQDEPIAGGFYEQELLRTKVPDIYLIEKVLRKRGNKLLVKWLGFDDSHNSWINKLDL